MSSSFARILVVCRSGTSICILVSLLEIINLNLALQEFMAFPNLSACLFVDPSGDILVLTPFAYRYLLASPHLGYFAPQQTQDHLS